MRMSFSRSEDISLLIVVDMLGWRLFVSLEIATKPGWTSTPTTGVCGHREQGTTLCPPFAKVVFNVTKQCFGILKYLMMQLHPRKCSLLSPCVLSSTRLNKEAKIASETFWEGNH